jgi:hypothetical protein
VRKLLLTVVAVLAMTGAANAGGWYLMVPRHEAHFVYQDRKTGLDNYDTITWPEARLYLWEQVATYSTPEDCMGVVRTWRTQMDNHWGRPTDHVTGKELAAAHQANAQAIGLQAALEFAA